MNCREIICEMPEITKLHIYINEIRILNRNDCFGRQKKRVSIREEIKYWKKKRWYGSKFRTIHFAFLRCTCTDQKSLSNAWQAFYLSKLSFVRQVDWSGSPGRLWKSWHCDLYSKNFPLVIDKRYTDYCYLGKVYRLLVVLVNLFIQRLMNVMLSGKIWEFNTQPRKSVYHLIFTVSRVSRILAQNNHLAQCKKDEQNIVRERLSNVMLHLWTKIDWSNA